MTPLLEVEGLRVCFSAEAGEVRAVDGASFSVERGGALGIVGESGAGKSVTALAVMGLLDASATARSGRVRFDGRDLLGTGPSEVEPVRGRRLAMVFQDPVASLHPHYRVGRQVTEAVTAHEPLSRAVASRRAVELLDLVGLREPARRAEQFPHELSGGMSQRVMIAMALAGEPELLIADEPTSALDVTVQARILELLDDLRRRLGMALVLVSHDLGVLARAVDEVIVMHGGRVVERGTVAGLLGNPAHASTQGLVRALRRLGRQRRPAPAPAGPALVELRDVVKRFRGGGGWARRRGGDVVAVDGVSLRVAEGEALGVVGETGSGKTTLARLLVGLVGPESGTVAYAGRDVAGLRGAARRALRREIQMVFQDPVSSLNPRRRVGAIVAEPLVVHRLEGDSRARRARVHGLLEQVGLDSDHAARFPHQLSGGQRQRVGIARALATRPRLIVADEPVSALDLSIQAQVLDLLDELRRALGLTLVLISHDLAVVRSVCDCVAVVRDGRVVEEGEVEALFRSPRHPHTAELLAAAPSLPLAANRPAGDQPAGSSDSSSSSS